MMRMAKLRALNIHILKEVVNLYYRMILAIGLNPSVTTQVDTIFG